MSGTRGRTVRRWAVPIAAAAVTAGLGCAAWTVGPPLAAVAMTHVTTADEGVRLISGGASASILVPRGWAVRPTIGDSSRLSLISPDGVMVIDLVVGDEVGAEAAARLLTPWSGPVLRERDGNGHTLVHARNDVGDTVVGWLSAPSSDAVAFRSTPSPGYDAQLALLLSTIELGP